MLIQAKYLCISMYTVRGPAARLHLVGVQPPELQLLLEEWTTDICWIVEFTSSVTKLITIILNVFPNALSSKLLLFKFP